VGVDAFCRDNIAVKFFANLRGDKSIGNNSVVFCREHFQCVIRSFDEGCCEIHDCTSSNRSNRSGMSSSPTLHSILVYLNGTATWYGVIRKLGSTFTNMEIAPFSDNFEYSEFVMSSVDENSLYDPRCLCHIPINVNSAWYLCAILFILHSTYSRSYSK